MKFIRGNTYRVYAKLAAENMAPEFIAETHGPVGTLLLVNELREKHCDGEITEIIGALGEVKIAKFFNNEEFTGD